MTIQDYYKEFISKVSSNMDLSLAKNDSIVTMIGKNSSFVDDYNVWVSVLDKRLECIIFKNALKTYQESLSNMVMGLYQPAFMGLRYFLERTLMGVYMSANELELRTWLAEEKDTYWSELIGEENEDRPTCNDKLQGQVTNTNKGLYSKKYTQAFNPSLLDRTKEFRALAKTVYRNCSLYVHGNCSVLGELGQKIEFSKDLALKWNDYADTISRCILYAFYLRYYPILSDESKSKVSDRLREEFSTISEINNELR